MPSNNRRRTGERRALETCGWRPKLLLLIFGCGTLQSALHSQPILPLGLAYVEGVTHDYFRRGTTASSAALDVAHGSVIAQCKPRPRHQQFLSFLRHIEASVPEHLEVHFIVDNYSTHKHAEVRAWLAKRPRYSLHFTPTYSSWINQLERWFALITQRAIRRDSFQPFPDLVRKIERFVTHYNAHPQPFMWTATADSILAKLERFSRAINGTEH